ncbi:MAG: ATP-binding protein [Caldilineaceae bacterium]
MNVQFKFEEERCVSSIFHLENIGLFIEADLEFIPEGEATPVTLITGENGTGKSILLEAIRRG